MDDLKDRFRMEAVKLIYIGQEKTLENLAFLKHFVVKSSDKSINVRRAVYRKLL